LTGFASLNPSYALTPQAIYILAEIPISRGDITLPTSNKMNVYPLKTAIYGCSRKGHSLFKVTRLAFLRRSVGSKESWG